MLLREVTSGQERVREHHQVEQCLLDQHRRGQPEHLSRDRRTRDRQGMYVVHPSPSAPLQVLTSEELDQLLSGLVPRELPHRRTHGARGASPLRQAPRDLILDRWRRWCLWRSSLGSAEGSSFASHRPAFGGRAGLCLGSSRRATASPAPTSRGPAPPSTGGDAPVARFFSLPPNAPYVLSRQRLRRTPPVGPAHRPDGREALDLVDQVLDVQHHPCLHELEDRERIPRRTPTRLSDFYKRRTPSSSTEALFLDSAAFACQRGAEISAHRC